MQKDEVTNITNIKNVSVIMPKPYLFLFIASPLLSMAIGLFIGSYLGSHL